MGPRGTSRTAERLTPPREANRAAEVLVERPSSHIRRIGRDRIQVEPVASVVQPQADLETQWEGKPKKQPSQYSMLFMAWMLTYLFKNLLKRLMVKIFVLL